jgi:PST family polysaccharide transporter
MLQSDRQGSHDQLMSRALRASSIRLIAQAVKLVVLIGSTAVLARLLTPTDFGLFAMINTLLLFIATFRDFGLTHATTYQTDLSAQQLNRLFWLNLRWNVVLIVVLALAAPLLAWLYNDSRLIAMTGVVIIGVFLFGMSTQPESLLTRSMHFTSLAIIDAGALLISMVVAIAMAWMGFGYWALVGQFVSDALIRCSTTWFICKWRPSAPDFGTSNSTDVSKVLHYSQQVTGYRVLTYIGKNIDQVLVGAISGAATLGLYSKAYQWSTFPMLQIYGSLLNVLVSSLSQVQNDPERYRQTMHRLFLSVFAICLPALAFMAIEAELVIRILLGDQWLEAVPLLTLFCVSAFVGSFSQLTKPLYLSQGQTQRQLTWGLITTPLMIAAVVVGSFWGSLGVAIGFTAMTALLTYPGVWFCLRNSIVRHHDFWGTVWRPASAALLSVALAPLISNALVPTIGIVWELLLRLLVFGVLYAAIFLGIPGGWREALSTLAALQREGATK